jgi:signal transduction histidine kinase
MQSHAVAAGVDLVVDAAGDPCPLCGDPQLLARAVENLLDNALRYTPPGGQVALGWRHSEAGVIFTVADSGPGITRSDLPHLFTPLYRGTASSHRPGGGAGLGLAISRSILEAHGGALSGANGPLGGAVFTGTLPDCP